MNFPPPTPNQARWLWRSLTALSIGVLVFLAMLLLWACGQLLRTLATVLLPLAIAGIIAYLLDPVVNFFERRKIPRARAILMVFFIAVAFVLILLSTVVPRLVYETSELIEKAPAYSRQLRQNLQTWMAESSFVRRVNQIWNFPTTAPTPVPVKPVASSTEEPALSPATTPTTATERISTPSPVSEAVLTWFNKILPQLAQWCWEQVKRAASFAGLLIGFFLIPIYVFYFLLEKAGIQQNWSACLPLRESKAKEELIFILSSINDCLIVFFRGQVLVALCSGTLLTLGFLILGLNYAVLLGVMAGVLGIIPYLGTAISVVPAVTLAAVQFGDWLHPALVLLIFGIVNLNESLVVSPRIIGDRVGLHPLTIIIAVMIGTTLLGGVLGGMLAIPLTAALRALMYRYVWKRA